MKNRAITIFIPYSIVCAQRKDGGWGLHLVGVVVDAEVGILSGDVDQKWIYIDPSTLLTYPFGGFLYYSPLINRDGFGEPVQPTRAEYLTDFPTTLYRVPNVPGHYFGPSFIPPFRVWWGDTVYQFPDDFTSYLWWEKGGLEGGCLFPIWDGTVSIRCDPNFEGVTLPVAPSEDVTISPSIPCEVREIPYGYRLLFGKGMRGKRFEVAVSRRGRTTTYKVEVWDKPIIKVFAPLRATEGELIRIKVWVEYFDKQAASRPYNLYASLPNGIYKKWERWVETRWKEALYEGFLPHGEHAVTINACDLLFGNAPEQWRRVTWTISVSPRTGDGTITLPEEASVRDDIYLRSLPYRFKREDTARGVDRVYRSPLSYPHFGFDAGMAEDDVVVAHGKEGITDAGRAYDRIQVHKEEALREFRHVDYIYSEEQGTWFLQRFIWDNGVRNATSVSFRAYALRWDEVVQAAGFLLMDLSFRDANGGELGTLHLLISQDDLQRAKEKGVIPLGYLGTLFQPKDAVEKVELRVVSWRMDLYYELTIHFRREFSFHSIIVPFWRGRYFPYYDPPLGAEGFRDAYALVEAAKVWILQLMGIGVDLSRRGWVTKDDGGGMDAVSRSFNIYSVDSAEGLDVVGRVRVVSDRGSGRDAILLSNAIKFVDDGGRGADRWSVPFAISVTKDAGSGEDTPTSGVTISDIGNTEEEARLVYILRRLQDAGVSSDDIELPLAEHQTPDSGHGEESLSLSYFYSTEDGATSEDIAGLLVVVEEGGAASDRPVRGIISFDRGRSNDGDTGVKFARCYSLDEASSAEALLKMLAKHELSDEAEGEDAAAPLMSFPDSGEVTDTEQFMLKDIRRREWAVARDSLILVYKEISLHEISFGNEGLSSGILKVVEDAGAATEERLKWAVSFDDSSAHEDGVTPIPLVRDMMEGWDAAARLARIWDIIFSEDSAMSGNLLSSEETVSYEEVVEIIESVEEHLRAVDRVVNMNLVVVRDRASSAERFTSIPAASALTFVTKGE